MAMKPNRDELQSRKGDLRWPIISTASSPHGKAKAPRDSSVGRANDLNFSHFLRPKPRDGSSLVGDSQGAHHLRNLGTGTRVLEPLSLNVGERNRPLGMGPSSCPLVPDMSTCSQGASNDLKASPKRRYQECPSSSQSDSDSEDSGRLDGAEARAKDRQSLAHRSLERRKSGGTKKKLRTLQELLPNCNKVDHVGVLDEAIEYLQTLQQLLLVLSSGSPMYMSPQLMLPPSLQQMYAPPYAGQFPMYNVGPGLGYPIPPVPGTAAPGLQHPAPPVPPSDPFMGRSSAQSLALDLSRPTGSPRGHQS